MTMKEAWYWPIWQILTCMCQVRHFFQLKIPAPCYRSNNSSFLPPFPTTKEPLRLFLLHAITMEFDTMPKPQQCHRFFNRMTCNIMPLMHLMLLYLYVHSLQWFVINQYVHFLQHSGHYGYTRMIDSWCLYCLCSENIRQCWYLERTPTYVGIHYMSFRLKLTSLYHVANSWQQPMSLACFPSLSSTHPAEFPPGQANCALFLPATSTTPGSRIKTPGQWPWGIAYRRNGLQEQ